MLIHMEVYSFISFVVLGVGAQMLKYCPNTDTPTGRVLTQCAFVYTLDCSEKQALAILQDSTFQYGVCQRYQYAKNASYSLPEPCSLEIIKNNADLEVNSEASHKCV